MGRLCYPTKHPATDPGTRQRRDYKIVPVRGGHGAVFAYPGTGFWEDYAHQGTGFWAIREQVLVHDV